MFRCLTVFRVQQLHARFALPSATPVHPYMLASVMADDHEALRRGRCFQACCKIAKRVMLNHTFQGEHKQNALLDATKSAVTC
jgi:hypothetical protein